MTDLVPFVPTSTDLVVSDYARLSTGGLTIAADASEDDLQRISYGMERLLSTSFFAMGDLGNHWKKAYPKTYRHWIENFSELQSGTVVKLMRLSRRFPNLDWRVQFLTPENGRRVLTSGHFEAVSSLSDEKATEFLERAAVDGLGVKALSALIKDVTEEKSPIIAPPDEPDSKFGYIYTLAGGHRLLCGDCTVPEHLAALFGNLQAGAEIYRARLVVTSPPYNQELDTFIASGMQTEKTTWVDRMAGAYDDDRDETTYQTEQVDVLDSLLAVTTPDASVFYNHKNRYRDKEIISPLVWLLRSKWKIRQEIIWDRGTSVTLNARMFAPSDERIYWLRRGDRFVWNEDSGAKTWFTVWKIAPRAEVQVSAPFPVELPTRCIIACSDPGDIVFDPYGGSGTTLIAAAQQGRRCFLIERDPSYCDVIRDRYARWTEEQQKANLPVIDVGPARMPEE